jgi:glycine cleavage system H lipoate-binding protein
MECPFLRETQVESCRHSLVRKLIVRNPENLSLERCSSPAYLGCPLYATAPENETASGSRCPFLDNSLVQFCAAAPVPKFIPFSEALLSRCGSAAFRYCDLYVAMAHPEEADVPHIDGIAVPAWLHYAGNHMWLDAAEDGILHIGIDAFLARTLGSVDRITYLTTRGVSHPAVVLSSAATDFHLVFPNEMLITSPNVYLRANSSKLTSDPYRSGWLFECRPSPDGSDPKAGLYAGGEPATRWMQSEFDRISAFVHNYAGMSSCGDHQLVADGGGFAPDLVRQLDRSQAAQLHHAFFSPASMR